MRDLNDIKLSPRQNLIAVGFILLIIATLGLRLYFDNKSHDIAGPEFIVANDNTIALVYNKNLYRLDNLGNIVQQFPLHNLFDNPDTADIQLLDDERFVIADWRGERIFLCEFSGPLCNPLTENLGKHIGNHFKFHYRASHKDIFIADTDRHRVIRYDTTTHQVDKLLDKKAFIYPNHLQIEADGFLYVTDTNHHRISRHKIEDNKLVDLEKYTRVPKSVSPKKWPVFYYRMQNGDLYILQANNVLAYADLVHITSDFEATKITLPAKSDITVMAKVSNTLLLLDRNQFAIHAMNLQTNDLSLFGGPDLLHIFKKDKRSMENWASLSEAMMAMMVLAILGMIGFIVYLAINNKQDIKNPGPKTETTISLPPITPGVVTWLDQNPFFRKIFIALIIMLVILAGLGFTIFTLLPLKPESLAENTDVITMAIYGFVFIILVTLTAAINNIFTRVGTDGIYIMVKRPVGTRKIEPANILYNKNYIVSGTLTLIYKNVQGQYFQDKDQFESYIMPLIKKYGKETSYTGILAHKIKHPGIMDILSVAFTLFGIYFIYYLFVNGIIPG